MKEAEEASLSGETPSTKAGGNTNHSNYSGSGFVDGFDDAGAAAVWGDSGNDERSNGCHRGYIAVFN